MTDLQKIEIICMRKSGLGYKAISNQMGISRDTVRSFCKRKGLAGELTKRQAEQAENKKEGFCRQCGKVLWQSKGVKKRVFCSSECREKWWHEHPDKIRKRAVYFFICAGCGKLFTAYGNSGRKYCSHKCYIKDRFKGGDDDE